MAAFTLVEVLVVLLIIGLVVGLSVLAVGTTGRDRELETEGERALALLTYVREQAELQTREFGLFCEEDGYEFLAFDPRTGVWRPVEEDEALRARELPEGLILSLVIEGRPVVLQRPLAQDDEQRMPHIMLFSNGDVTSFELTLQRVGVTEGNVRIRSTSEGTIEAVPPQEQR